MTGPDSVSTRPLIADAQALGKVAAAKGNENGNFGLRRVRRSGAAAVRLLLRPSDPGSTFVCSRLWLQFLCQDLHEAAHLVQAIDDGAEILRQVLRRCLWRTYDTIHGALQGLHLGPELEQFSGP